jgi:signal recognition particle receptor subunit beta
LTSVNPLTKELLLKIVYYGPGLSGKTTALTFLHRAASPERRGKMVSLATPVDRTLYFDLVPPNLPKVGGNRVKLQLFTVPGQVHYNATRKLVLTGADGIVFVADSRRSRMEANAESLDNLRANLEEREIALDEMPLVFHYNKRDASDTLDVEALEQRLNPDGRESIETCAITGQGIQRGLEMICKQVIAKLEGQGDLDADDPIDHAAIDNVLTEATPTLEPPRPPAATQAGPTEPESTPTPQEPAADADASTGLSFASLWRPEDRDRPAAIERSLVTGRDADAARSIWEELGRLLTTTGKELAWSSPAGMVSLLGLDGARYLDAARLAALAKDGKPIPRRKLLEAYLFLAQTASLVCD